MHMPIINGKAALTERRHLGITVATRIQVLRDCQVPGIGLNNGRPAEQQRFWNVPEAIDAMLVDQAQNQLELHRPSEAFAKAATGQQCLSAEQPVAGHHRRIAEQKVQVEARPQPYADLPLGITHGVICEHRRTGCSARQLEGDASEAGGGKFLPCPGQQHPITAALLKQLVELGSQCVRQQLHQRARRRASLHLRVGAEHHDLRGIGRILAIQAVKRKLQRLAVSVRVEDNNADVRLLCPALQMLGKQPAMFSTQHTPVHPVGSEQRRLHTDRVIDDHLHEVDRLEQRAGLQRCHINHHTA
ncbi:hypothetical protein D3C79_719280 [compost metagenome]